jgi:hypothetical protein
LPPQQPHQDTPQQPHQDTPQQPRQDTPRVKRNFIMTDTDIDNSQPLPLPAPRARKRVVKTYKFNKHLNYKRGLQILKKISE